MGWESRRDQRIADDTMSERALQCVAHGCPNLWSVDAGSGKLCGAHAGAPPRLWPQVTQEELDAQADRARRLAAQTPVQKPPMSEEERQAIASRMRMVMSSRREVGRQWAYALRDRHQGGERLSNAQIEAYQAALSGRFSAIGEEA